MSHKCPKCTKNCKCTTGNPDFKGICSHSCLSWELEALLEHLVRRLDGLNDNCQEIAADLDELSGKVRGYLG